jgi:hypothetical protein
MTMHVTWLWRASLQIFSSFAAPARSAADLIALSIEKWRYRRPNWRRNSSHFSGDAQSSFLFVCDSASFFVTVVVRGQKWYDHTNVIVERDVVALLDQFMG